MLVLLFIFALIHHLQGAPTEVPSPLGHNPSEVFSRDETIGKHFTTRGVNDIVISCLATIFACTWTAIHPNIPDPCDSGWEIFMRQVTTMIYAILAPEIITAWALRQHLAARKIAREYNHRIARILEVPDERPWLVRFVDGVKRWCGRKPLEGVKEWFRRHPTPRVAKEGEVVPWTITHGFFQQMGGFVLCEGGRPIEVIDDVLHKVQRQKSINAPRITEGEIQDRSKGDGLTKTIVVLQTTWFVAQCIVRSSSRLPVTELEILTLGFAMLNGITYALWWHKPQGVRLPVYLEMKARVGSTTGERREGVGREHSRALDGRGGALIAELAEKEEAEVTAGEERRGEEQRGGLVEGRENQEQDEASGTRTAAVSVKEAPPLSLPKRSYLTRKIKGDWSTGWQRIWRIPNRLCQAVLRPIAKMSEATQSPQLVGGALHVPMFFSSRADDVTVFIASSATASIFGLIHLIPAFFLDFPSHPEKLLWRLSASIITVQPLSVVISRLQDNSIILTVCLCIAVFGAPLYIIARLTLIVLALLSLPTLHGTALVTVDWISFIPHL